MRQRNDAKMFKEHMKMERDKLYAYKEKMVEIRSFISSEESEINTLMDKLRKMQSELESAMKKPSFSSAEAEYFKGIQKISESIISLLSTEFLEDGFSISKKYQKAFSEIERINQEIPYSPLISDGNTAAFLKKDN